MMNSQTCPLTSWKGSDVDDGQTNLLCHVESLSAIDEGDVALQQMVYRKVHKSNDIFQLPTSQFYK
jgi:hypothetical protein